MVAKFERQGISFQYPDNWTEEIEENESGWMVTIQSPATAFFALTLDESMPGIGAMADAALEAMREVYTDLESEPAASTVAGLPAIGHDLDFFSLDLTNICVIRALATGAGTVLVLTEANDQETTNLDVLKAIGASLKIDDED